jgi:hypothetical protein
MHAHCYMKYLVLLQIFMTQNTILISFVLIMTQFWIFIDIFNQAFGFFTICVMCTYTDVSVGKRFILMLFPHRIPLSVLKSSFRMRSSCIAIALFYFIKRYRMKQNASIKSAICRAIMRYPYIQRTPSMGCILLPLEFCYVVLCFSMSANGALDFSISFHELALHKVTKGYRMKMANRVHSFLKDFLPLKC